MIIGNSFVNTHTKFHYNRFLRSEDTSDPRGGVKPEIRRRRRLKFAVGEMPVGPSAADGRAGPRPSRADGHRGPMGVPVGWVCTRRGPTGAPVGRVRGNDVTTSRGVTW